MFFAFIGVLVINDPFGSSDMGDEKKGDFLVGSIFASTGALAAALASLCMRYMTDIHYSISPFWFATGGAMWSPILYVFSSGPAHAGGATTKYDYWTIGMLTIQAIFGQIALNLRSKSF